MQEMVSVIECENMRTSDPRPTEEEERDGDSGQADEANVLQSEDEAPHPNEDEPTHQPSFELGAEETLRNFYLMSVLFSLNHGATVSCLSLATARLGEVGAWQSGTLYLAYTASAILGATYVVKELGARNALVAGMWTYCAYIACFVVVLSVPGAEMPVAIVGGVVGGIGGGFLWTAQGSYFGRTSEEYAEATQTLVGDATSILSGRFAAIYLAGEVTMKLLSTMSIELFDLSWVSIFASYTVVATISAAGMIRVHKYREVKEQQSLDQTLLLKATVALKLLVRDPKMKYMVGINFVFGFAGAFINSVVNGEVTPLSLNDDRSVYVGVLSSVTALVAAIMSVIFGFLEKSHRLRKITVLSIGSLSFSFVATLFIAKTGFSGWGWGSLLVVYSLQGIGRATFEGTLRAEFEDLFSYEKEGAFANIVLQSGLSSAVGFFLSVNLHCSEPTSYCVEFEDGELHAVLPLEVLTTAAGAFAILGLWRVSRISSQESDAAEELEAELLSAANSETILL